MVVGSHGMFTLCFLVFGSHLRWILFQLSGLSFAERNVKKIQLNFFKRITFDWALHSLMFAWNDNFINPFVVMI